MVVIGCARQRETAPPSLDEAAHSYVRLVLALGERDADSVDSYYGPSAWRDEARQRAATLTDIQRDTRALVDTLTATRRSDGDARRRAFLVRQLTALSARIDIIRGERPR